MWDGFFRRIISLNKIFSFWKLKMSFTAMFYENLKKVQLEFNVKIHCEISVKLIFHEILWKKKKYSERKISQCILRYRKMIKCSWNLWVKMWIKIWKLVLSALLCIYVTKLFYIQLFCSPWNDFLSLKLFTFH